MDLNKIKQKEFKYWENYYEDTLKLPDWKIRANARVQAIDETLDLNYFFPENFRIDNKKILDAGCGTGTFLLNCLKKSKKSLLCGFDTNSKATKLAFEKLTHFKAKQQEILIAQANLEDKVFKTDFFDYIFCGDVLEHVNNIHKSITNLWDLLAPGGSLFIHVPDYRWPQEPHYKIHVFPNKKWMVRQILRLKKRPEEFLTTLNFISPKVIKNIIAKKFPKALIEIRYRRYKSLKGKLVGNIAKMLNLKYDLLITKN